MPTDPREPPITPLDSHEPPFDPAAASAPGPSGPVISPDDPDAPYGSFGDATGATTIYPPEDGIVRVERETYRDEWTVEVTDVTDESASPELDAPRRPIEDMSLEELLDRPIDGASPPTTEAADSDAADDEAAPSGDEHERPDDEGADDEGADDEGSGDEDDGPDAPGGGARFLRP